MHIMNDFAIFKRFNDPGLAYELAEELRKNGIEFQVIDDSPSVDITFTNNSTFQKETQLMIRQTDFEKANKIQEEYADEILMNLNKDHYLFEFTNDELYEILEKPDEWNYIDYKLAQKILKDRGKNINEHLLKSLKQERITELSEPDKGDSLWIIIGYISALLGGFLGVTIGWIIWTMKKTLPNGEKIYVYSESDRKHGKIMLIIGIIIFPSACLIAILNRLNS